MSQFPSRGAGMPRCNPVASPTHRGWIPLKSAGNLKFPPQGIGFSHGEKLREEHHGTLVRHTDSFLLFVEPLFRLSHEGEGKQTEPDAGWCNIFDDDGVALL